MSPRGAVAGWHSAGELVEEARKRSISSASP
jgi:hypothetical protein